MLIRLKPEDSSILTRIAQYSNEDVAPDVFAQLLAAASPAARDIAEVIMGQQNETQVSDDIAETARFFREWARNSNAYSSARIAGGY